MCFDISDANAMESLQQTIAQLGIPYLSQMAVIIVGCKNDLPATVTMTSCLQLKTQFPTVVSCIKTSSLSKFNLDRLQAQMDQIVLCMYKYWKYGLNVQPEMNIPTTTPSSSCAIC